MPYITLLRLQFRLLKAFSQPSIASHPLLQAGRTKVPLCSTGLRPLRGRCPASPHSNSQSLKAGQQVSLTTYCPWATCSLSLSSPSFHPSYLSLFFPLLFHFCFLPFLPFLLLLLYLVSLLNLCSFCRNVGDSSFLLFEVLVDAFLNHLDYLFW